MFKKTEISPKVLLIGAWVSCLLLVFFLLRGAYLMSVGSFSSFDVMVVGLNTICFFGILLVFRESLKRENENRIRILFESTPVPLHCMDSNGNITRVSDMWLDFFKLHRDEAIGRNFSEFLCEESKKVYVKRVLKGFRQDKKCRDVQVKALANNNEVVDVFVSASPISQSIGKVEVMVVLSPEKGRNTNDVCQRLDCYDSLTGLPNNFLLKDRLKNALERCRTSREKVAFLQIDIDRYKGKNGNISPDLLLMAISKRLKANIRTGDTLARLPGGEFALLPYGIQQPESLIPLADRLRRLLNQPLKIEEEVVRGTASIGIALYPEDGRNIETLLRKANIAMYAAKAEGGDKFYFSSSKLNAQAEARVVLQKKLGKALLKEEFSLFYQTQVEMVSGRTVGFEALLRWNSPKDGLLLPGDFLPVVEDSELVFLLGEWTLRHACRQIKVLMQGNHPNLRISINIFKKHFMSSGFISCVDRILQESQIDPSLLEMDLQENLLMVESGKVVEKLLELKKRGIRLAIDDYGLGRCSITQLKYLPIDRIKIARKFLENIPRDQDSEALIETFLGLAQGLGLKTLVKGIENKEQCRFLIDLNCREGQGFYFSRPSPPEDCLQVLSPYLPRMVGKSA